jgi:hypothetical protein
MADNKVVYQGPNFLTLLLLLFITLKLTGHITWSWWLVLAPLWGSILFALGFFLVACIIVGIGISKRGRRW